MQINSLNQRGRHSVVFTLALKVTRHFPDVLCLCVNTSLHAKPFIWKCLSSISQFSCKSNSFSYEKFCARTCFETEAKDNLEQPRSQGLSSSHPSLAPGGWGGGGRKRENRGRNRHNVECFFAELYYILPGQTRLLQVQCKFYIGRVLCSTLPEIRKTIWQCI